MVTVTKIPNYGNCHRNSFCGLILLFALAASPWAMAGGEPEAVTGTVTYRERIALTPEAVVEVQLLDVSIADASAKLIAEQTIKPQHQVPIPFELTYDPAVIDERFTYTVRATIRERGQLMFTTDRSYRVLTRGSPKHVDLVLVRTSN
jgi:putative lipoprotein